MVKGNNFYCLGLIIFYRGNGKDLSVIVLHVVNGTKMVLLQVNDLMTLKVIKVYELQAVNKSHLNETNRSINNS